MVIIKIRLFSPVMEINEYEAGMLDAVLEAFAGRQELHWTELMELFDGDEELAAAITDILAGSGLITKLGEETKSGLPEKILQTEATAPFMEKGGFTAQVKQPATEDLSPAPEPTIEVEPEIIREPEIIPEPEAIVGREVVFEIENNLPEEEPTLKLETAPPIAAPETEETQVLQNEPEKPAPDILLNQEIAQLRFEQRKFDHRLREKDMAIQELNSHIKVLSQFRLFIWVLLGIIALLALGLVFYKH